MIYNFYFYFFTSKGRILFELLNFYLPFLSFFLGGEYGENKKQFIW